MSVAVAAPLRPERALAPVPDLHEGEATTVELVTVSAAIVGIAILLAVSCALLVVGHQERMETAFFLTAFAAAPAGVALARRQLARVGPGRSTTLALLDVAGLAATILAARGLAALEGTSVVPWTLLVGATVLAAAHVAVRRRPSLLPGPLEGQARTFAIVASGMLLLAATTSFLPRPLFAPQRLWLVVLACLAVSAARTFGRAPTLGRRGRGVLDAVVLAVTVLVVADVSDYGGATRYDYDFFLGPVNAIEHGHPILVDTFSQYGVGVFYALAAVFHAVPLGYGGLQFVLGVAYAVEFGLVYAVLRLACRSQLVAIVGLGVTLVATLALPLPHIAYPSTGPFRFALPWVVILAGTLRARSTKHRRVYESAMLFTVGAAAVWSAETFVYAFAAFAAIAVFSFGDDATTAGRAHEIAKWIAGAVVAGFVAVGAASAALLVAAGEWPSWPAYLSLVALYAMRGFGSLLIPTWSTGYLVGATYVLSLAALVALPRARRLQHAPTIAATAGATAFGAVAFTYFLGRSAPTNLHHVAAPVVVVLCGWWTVTAPHLRRHGRAVHSAAILGAACLAAALVAANSNALAIWVDETPLAAAAASPGAPASKLADLLRRQDRDARIVEGARLIRAYATSGELPAVLIRASRTTGVLLAAHRGNALPIVNPNQDVLLDAPALKRVAAATDRLPEGTIVLTEAQFMRRSPRSFASLDPIRDRFRFGDYFVARSFATLRQQHDLHVIARGRLGYVVLEVGGRR